MEKMIGIENMQNDSCTYNLIHVKLIKYIKGMSQSGM